jgi:hypothetical protein
MSAKAIKVRKWAKIIPGLVWAAIFDIVDAIFSPLNTALVTLFGAGVALDAAVDLVLAFCSLFVFEDPRMWVVGGAAEIMIPPPFDLFPSYTATYIALQNGVIK